MTNHTDTASAIPANRPPWRVEHAATIERHVDSKLSPIWHCASIHEGGRRASSAPRPKRPMSRPRPSVSQPTKITPAGTRVLSGLGNGFDRQRDVRYAARFANWPAGGEAARLFAVLRHMPDETELLQRRHGHDSGGQRLLMILTVIGLLSFTAFALMIAR